MPDPSTVVDVFRRDRYTMRFKSPRLEEAFSASRHQTMCLNISRIATIGSLPVLARIELTQRAQGGAVDLWDSVTFISLCILLALSLLWATVPRLERFQRWASFGTLEGIAMFMGVTFLVFFLDLPFRLAFRLSDDDTELLPRSTERHQKIMAMAALGLDAVVTCWHLALPVRWSVIVWMDALFIFSFAVSAYTRGDLSPGDVEVHVILTFSALVMGTSIGLRSTEDKDRVLFASILDEKATRAEALSNLLASICDAVVELDASGKITSGFSSLSDLLLLGPANVSQRRDRELGPLLFSDGDRATLAIMMKGAQAGAGTDLGRRADMRDSCGSRVRMELYMVPFKSAGSEQLFMVGIKEHSHEKSNSREIGQEEARDTAQALAALPSSVGRSPPPPRRSPEHSREDPQHHPSARGTISEVSISEFSEFSQSSEQSSIVQMNTLKIVSDQRGKGVTTTVWVNATSRYLPMIQCTQSFFMMLGGPDLVQDQNILDWVKPEKRKVFVGHLLRAVEQILSATDQRSPSIRVRLYPPSLHSFHAQVWLGVSLDVYSDNQGESLKLTCIKIELVHHRPKAPRRASARAPARAAPQPTGAGGSGSQDCRDQAELAPRPSGGEASGSSGNTAASETDRNSSERQLQL